MLKNIFLFFFLFFPLLCKAQVFNRIQADYSIKIKNADSTSSLNMGTLYFDLQKNKIVFQNKFPKNEIWITKDTVIYQIANSKVIKRIKTPKMNESTFFYLILKGKLANFGLPAAGFVVKNVEKQDNLVITTWLPPEKYHNIFGEILVSHRDGHIDAVVMKDKNGNLVSRQFFRKFVVVQGLVFPTEIVQISYSAKGKENYQLSNYKNIRINDYSENTMYDYPIR